MIAPSAAGFPFLFAAAILLLSALGCGPRPDLRAAPTKIAFAAAPRHPKRVTNRPANPNGVVFILEYHRVTPDERRWDRSIARFKSDLIRLYRMGFRPVALCTYLDGKMVRPSRLEEWFGRQKRPRLNALQMLKPWRPAPAHQKPTRRYDPLPPGAMPVVFTFDDSDRTQFHILPNGSLDPKCAVGIWSTFARRHPDFPVRATFYVLPDVMWSQRKWRKKKLRMLREWGCEIGSHTMSHTSLGRLTDVRVKQELAGSIEFIRAQGFEPETIATPYGVAPKNRALLKGFWWKHRHYGFRGVLLGGGGPAPSTKSRRFNPYRLPRTQGIDSFLGLTYFLNKVRAGKIQPFVAP